MRSQKQIELDVLTDELGDSIKIVKSIRYFIDKLERYNVSVRNSAQVEEAQIALCNLRCEINKSIDEIKINIGKNL